MSINRVVLMGRLTADPELKTTQNGISVTSFNIAVDRNYSQGEERKADFFTIVCWRTTAEFVCKYFRKGSMIAIDGRLESRNYQDKNGNNRTAIEVVADTVSFTGEKKEDAPNNNAPQNNQQQSRQQQSYQQPNYEQQSFSQTTPDIYPYDDLPF